MKEFDESFGEELEEHKVADEQATLFDVIINSVSKQDLMKDYQGLSRAELREKMEEPIDEQTQKFYLAYYARML